MRPPALAMLRSRSRSDVTEPSLAVNEPFSTAIRTGVRGGTKYVSSFRKRSWARRRDDVPNRSTAMRPYFRDRKSTRLNSSHSQISYAVFCLKKKKKTKNSYDTAE